MAAPLSANQLDALEHNAAKYGITHWGLGDENNGIVHVVGPENGITLPGATIVCGDSHTSTHGAFGAIAFGIGFAIGIGFEFRSIYHGPKSPTLFMNIGQDYCACAFHNRPCSRT